MPDVLIREADLYTPGGPHSFLRDVMAAAGAPVHGVNARDAEQRLQNHTAYEESRLEATAIAARDALAAHGLQARGGGVSSRALSTGAGAGGELVPPKWMTQLWASVAHAACPLRSLATRVDLPPGTMELHVPRFDASAGVVPEAAENTNAPDQFSETDATVTKVATFAGDALISQASYDRGGDFSDTIVAQEMADSYAGSLAQQLMSGTGTNGQMLGLLNVTTSTVNNLPGARLATYTSASPTPSGVIQAVASCAAQVSDTRLRSPSAVLMRGSRWFWMAGSPDGSGNEPVQRPGTGQIPTDTDTGPFGPIASLPVYHDNTIPTNLGAGADQDAIVVVRGRDIILLEDPAGPRFTAYLGGGTAGELSVVLQWHAYAAVIPHRYPSAIGTVQGTGLVVPSGF